jgi:hypothetical protein
MKKNDFSCFEIMNNSIGLLKGINKHSNGKKTKGLQDNNVRMCLFCL